MHKLLELLLPAYKYCMAIGLSQAYFACLSSSPQAFIAGEAWCWDRVVIDVQHAARMENSQRMLHVLSMGAVPDTLHTVP